MKKKTILYICLFTFLFTELILYSACKKSDKDENDPMPVQTTGTITDIDGNTYKTIKIGNQWWMAENLKTSKLNDGTAIPLIIDSIEWSNLSAPGYCWYNNDQLKNMDTYGAL